MEPLLKVSLIAQAHVFSEIQDLSFETLGAFLPDAPGNASCTTQQAVGMLITLEQIPRRLCSQLDAQVRTCS
jgi:hypothetical protein